MLSYVFSSSLDSSKIYLPRLEQTCGISTFEAWLRFLNGAPWVAKSEIWMENICGEKSSAKRIL